MRRRRRRQREKEAGMKKVKPRRRYRIAVPPGGRQTQPWLLLQIFPSTTGPPYPSPVPLFWDPQGGRNPRRQGVVNAHSHKQWQSRLLLLQRGLLAARLCCTRFLNPVFCTVCDASATLDQIGRAQASPRRTLSARVPPQRWL
eukprot:gene16057-biopygen2217